MGLKKFFTPPTVLPLLRLLTLILLVVATVIIATNSIAIQYWNLTYIPIYVYTPLFGWPAFAAVYAITGKQLLPDGFTTYLDFILDTINFLFAPFLPYFCASCFYTIRLTPYISFFPCNDINTLFRWHALCYQSDFVNMAVSAEHRKTWDVSPKFSIFSLVMKISAGLLFMGFLCMVVLCVFSAVKLARRTMNAPQE
ncbi:hypothetical protein AMTRI_Chr03g145220 [Amborella trichopoda]